MYQRLIIILLLFSGCSTGIDKYAYYNFYSQFQEGSYLSVESEGIKYLLQYRSPEFMALNEVKSNKEFIHSEYKEALDKYSDGLHFCLRLMTHDTGNVLEHNLRYQNQYYDRLAILNNGFQQLVKGLVEDDSDTLYSVFHHYERIYNLRPFEQVLFTLDNSKNILPNTIIFNDQLFTGSRIEFVDFKDYLFNQPQLNL